MSSCLVVMLAIASPIVSAHPAAQPAPPPLPASFYGTVTVEDPGGELVVVAVIGGVEYARQPLAMHDGQWIYTLKVPADNPSTPEIEGGRLGDTITFYVKERVVASANWQGGSNTRLDLKIEQVALAQAGGRALPVPWLLAGLIVLLVLTIFILFWRRRRLSGAGVSA
ncbi:MAG: hypothetical protein L0332_21285 [Chloroflexi bacterium]|nr:hypothetical protein [Chloroflexota bacterium]MCI0578719.1 hypothetical protein [Chloroflexota bacterium]MCI0644368.1 hypothetical protein [Chloroflexota bacterium]MCI0729230.1 hypothetical protein [Chloroflexota bacterium]